MSGNADAPADQHPDEPGIAGVVVEIERGEQADHKHVDAEMDEKRPDGPLLRRMTFTPLRAGEPHQ